MSGRTLFRVMLVLALIGLADAAYLTIVHYGGLKIVCTSGHNGHSSCATVQTSKYSAVADPASHTRHERVMLNSVEEPFEIDIDDPGFPCFDCRPGSHDRLVGTSSWTEAEASVRERWLEDR